MKLRVSRRNALLALAAISVAPTAALSSARRMPVAELGAWIKAKADPRELDGLRRRALASDVRAGVAAGRTEGLTEAMSADFHADRSLVVDGWLLSQTECALYLAAFEEGRA